MVGAARPAVKPADTTADPTRVEASEYALVQGMRSTRAALATWRASPWPVLGSWVRGALAAAGLLLAAVAVVALVSRASPGWVLPQPPFVVGGPGDVVQILVANGLVLALHAMACLAGFIAGSSLPLEADRHTGRMRVIHERGPTVAIGFVVCATAFSLSMQLFLPLAAWIQASRRGEWERLLAATAVTVSLAVPILIAAAVWEVYVAPHLLTALLGTLPA
jgi:hypothetical protein